MLALNTASAHRQHPSAFDAAFKQRSPAVQHGNLKDLESRARSGEQASLEKLVGMARDHSEAGMQAESILFDLYARPQPGQESLPQRVRELVTNARQFDKPHNQPDKLNPHSHDRSEAPDSTLHGCKLRYIAGGETRGEREALSAELGEMVWLDGEKDLWGKNRFITAAELEADLNRLKKQVGSAEGFDPVTSIQAYAPNTARDWRFVPVQLEDHFVLVCDRTLPKGSSEAVVFSSEPLNKKQLSELQSRCPSPNIIQASLQGHVPNGCALFVRAAREHLATDSHARKAPEMALRHWAKTQAQMSAAQAQEFNLSGRRQMFGQLVDTIRESLSETAATSTDVSQLGWEQDLRTTSQPRRPSLAESSSNRQLAASNSTHPALASQLQARFAMGPKVLLQQASQAAGDDGAVDGVD